MNVEEEDVFQPAPEDVIQDWMLNWVIRGVTLDQSYKKEDYKPITPERFEGLKQFTFSAGTHPEAYPETLDIYVHSLEGLQYGKDLYKIDLSYNKIKDLSPLSKLTNLGDLRFYMNELTTLKPLSGLVNLERLNCGHNTISDLTPLKKMSKLKYLAMESNNIKTLNGLEGCTSLQEVTLRNNNITDISALEGVTNIEKMLWLGDNKITDISALKNMTKLKELDLINNQVSDITPLANLRNLESLNLGNNKNISDITPLTELTKLTKGKLNLSGTKIETKKDLLFEVINVNRLIEKFNANTVELGDKTNVIAARKAYNKASEDAKSYINENRISVAEKNIKLLEEGKAVEPDSSLSKYDKYYEADKSTINIFVGNADRQPLKNVKFSVKKQGSDEVLSEISTDGNGIAEYTFPTAVKTLTYNISLNEESKFTGDKDVITVEVNEEGQIGKINGTAVDKPSINRTLQLNAGEVLCVNKQNLEKAIKKAETVKEAGHTEESYKALKNALAQANSVNENENATQEQIDAAEEKLINAIDGLEKGPDYKTLHIAFVDSKGVAIPGLKFTVGNSWTPGTTDIESDADGLAEYTTQGRSYNYYTIDMLESKKYEKVRIRLVEEQSKVTKIEVYYVKGEYGANSELIKSITVDDPADLSFFVEVAEKEKEKLDLKGLQTQLSIARGLKKADYTEESWNAFYPVFWEANEVRNNEDATQQQVDEARTKLEQAIAGLEKIAKPEPKPEPTPEIKKVSSVALKTTVYTYNGKVKSPAVVAKNDKKEIIPLSDYTVKYASGRKNVGKYSVTVTFKNDYKGKYTKTFTIIPKGTQVKSLKAAKKSFKATWARQKTQVSGYQLQYARNKSFKSSVKTSTISNNKTVSKTVTKLTAKKTYYVRVRTYKNVKVNGKTMKLYSGWSTVKKTTVK